MSKKNESSTKNTHKSIKRRYKFKSTLWYICGLLEILFSFRLFLKLFGANPSNAFVQAIYSSSGFFLKPFNGIFSSTVQEGMETKSIFEPTVIIAMFVYMVITYAIVRLIEIYEK